MHDLITFTREELYNLVWEKPMSRLAAEYSISDAGLAKLCARHNIPTPPRGYWAKLQVGKAPSRPKLPSSKDNSPVALRLTRPDEQAGEILDELALAIADAKRPENRIAVAERLQAPCALVQEARAALNDAEPDHHGILTRPASCIDLRVSRPQLSRALRIADALLKAFANRGWEVAVEDGRTFVYVCEPPIAIIIEEVLETVEAATKPNLAGSYSFHYNRRETVRKPSGHLSIRIRERQQLWNHNQQRNWRGSAKRALEEHLNDVIVGLLKLASAVNTDVARRERQALEEQERQRRLQVALDEQRCLRETLAQEKANVERLLEQATHWRESQNLRLFVEQARERGAVPGLGLEGQELSDWIQWALRQADRLDPFTPSPPSILDEAERIEHMCDGLRGYR